MEKTLSIFFLFVLVFLGSPGCNNSSTLNPIAESPGNLKGEKDLAKESALRVSGKKPFYMCYDAKFEDAISDSANKRKIKLHGEYSCTPTSHNHLSGTIREQTVIGNGEFFNHSCEIAVEIKVKEFTVRSAVFEVSGTYQIGRPNPEFFQPNRPPQIKEPRMLGPKNLLQTKTVEVNWQATEVVSFDMSEIDELGPYRSFLGDEIRILIANPQWSEKPIPDIE